MVGSLRPYGRSGRCISHGTRPQGQAQTSRHGRPSAPWAPRDNEATQAIAAGGEHAHPVQRRRTALSSTCFSPKTRGGRRRRMGTSFNIGATNRFAIVAIASKQAGKRVRARTATAHLVSHSGPSSSARLQTIGRRRSQRAWRQLRSTVVDGAV
jgi:hypothetical protein